MVVKAPTARTVNALMACLRPIPAMLVTDMNLDPHTDHHHHLMPCNRKYFIFGSVIHLGNYRDWILLSIV